MTMIKKTSLRENIVPKVSDKFEIGTILSSDWGYDQSSIYFYMIVSLTDSFATVVPMKKEIKSYSENGIMNLIPTKIDEFAVEKYGVIRKKIRYNSGEPTIDIHDFETAYLWKGTEMNSDLSFR